MFFSRINQISFCFQTPESLSKYKDAWDIVLAEDPTVDVLMAIVNEVIAGDGATNCC